MAWTRASNVRRCPEPGSAVRRVFAFARHLLRNRDVRRIDAVRGSVAVAVALRISLYRLKGTFDVTASDLVLVCSHALPDPPYPAAPPCGQQSGCLRHRHRRPQCTRTRPTHHARGCAGEHDTYRWRRG